MAVAYPMVQRDTLPRNMPICEQPPEITKFSGKVLERAYPAQVPELPANVAA